MATPMEPMDFSSHSLMNDAPMSSRFTCEGENISPSLFWHTPPDTTKSFAIIVDDPDAPGGPWVHWVLYNIPMGVRFFDDGDSVKLPPGIETGLNNWGEKGYKGPCPPSGEHHYHFKLYALDTMLKVDPKMTAQKLEKAMKGHILEQTKFIGLYTKGQRY